MNRRWLLLAVTCLVVLGSCDSKSVGPDADDDSMTQEADDGGAKTPTTTAAATTTTVGGIVDTSSELLRLIEASTDGMVPPEKQVCYRDALLEVLPYGVDTVLEIPPTVDKDTLQQVLATAGISVQQQGDLLGTCMMAP
jgi:hypothetical protein